MDNSSSGQGIRLLPALKSIFLVWLNDNFNLSNRQPLTLTTFATIVLPPLFCYYATTVLVLLPGRGSLVLRIGLLPVTIWTAFRATTSIDCTLGPGNHALHFYNYGLNMALGFIVLRAMQWCFRLQPLKRLSAETAVTQSSEQSPRKSEVNIDTQRLLLDTLDLITNIRGIGWDWSGGLYIPREKRNTHSRMLFSLATFVYVVEHFLIIDFLAYVIHTLRPPTKFGLGARIFDPALPPILQFLHAYVVNVFAGVCMYHALQLMYFLATLVGVVVFRQEPAQWPPLFDAPWKCTSIAAYWSKGWHQLYRSSFVELGSTPLSYIFGRVGQVMGAFILSAVVHTLGMWGLGRGTNFWRAGGSFLMMGIGVILEYVYRKVSGRKVGGFWGWLWTMVWITFWFMPMTDILCEKGMYNSEYVPVQFRPIAQLIGYIQNAWSE